VKVATLAKEMEGLSKNQTSHNLGDVMKWISLIEEVFGERKRNSLEEFQEIVEKITSKMFLAVTIFKFIHYYIIDLDSLAIIAALH
jgi:hypothetical protein